MCKHSAFLPSFLPLCPFQSQNQLLNFRPISSVSSHIAGGSRFPPSLFHLHALPALFFRGFVPPILPSPLPHRPNKNLVLRLLSESSPVSLPVSIANAADVFTQKRNGIKSFPFTLAFSESFRSSTPGTTFRSQALLNVFTVRVRMPNSAGNNQFAPSLRHELNKYDVFVSSSVMHAVILFMTLASLSFACPRHYDRPPFQVCKRSQKPLL